MTHELQRLIKLEVSSLPHKIGEKTRLRWRCELKRKQGSFSLPNWLSTWYPWESWEVGMSIHVTVWIRKKKEREKTSSGSWLSFWGRISVSDHSWIWLTDMKSRCQLCDRTSIETLVLFLAEQRELARNYAKNNGRWNLKWSVKESCSMKILVSTLAWFIYF